MNVLVLSCLACAQASNNHLRGRRLGWPSAARFNRQHNPNSRDYQTKGPCSHADPYCGLDSAVEVVENMVGNFLGGELLDENRFGGIDTFPGDSFPRLGGINSFAAEPFSTDSQISNSNFGSGSNIVAGRTTTPQNMCDPWYAAPACVRSCPQLQQASSVAPTCNFGATLVPAVLAHPCSNSCTSEVRQCLAARTAAGYCDNAPPLPSTLATTTSTTHAPTHPPTDAPTDVPTDAPTDADSDISSAHWAVDSTDLDSVFKQALGNEADTEKRESAGAKNSPEPIDDEGLDWFSNIWGLENGDDNKGGTLQPEQLLTKNQANAEFSNSENDPWFSSLGFQMN